MKKTIILLIILLGIILLNDFLINKSENDCMKLHGASYCEKAIQDLQK